VGPIVSPQIARLQHCLAHASSRQSLARRHSQSHNQIAGPIVEQAYWLIATLRLATRRVTAPRSVIKRREHELWA
jgi:hypothetical protein